MIRELEKAYRSRAAAREYDSRHRKSRVRRMVSLREVRIVADFLGDLGEDAPVLDAACGTGRLSAFLRTKGWRILSMDVSRDMLLTGVEGGTLSTGRAAEGSIFRLPFGDKRLKGSACIRFMHHLPKRRQRVAALAELCRVTDGPVVVSLWTRGNLQHLRRLIKRLAGRRPSARYAGSLRAFKQDLDSAGLALKRVRFLYPFVSETVYLLACPKEENTEKRTQRREHRKHRPLK